MSRFEGFDEDEGYEDVSEVSREDWRAYCRAENPDWTNAQCDADYDKYLRKLRRI